MSFYAEGEYWEFQLMDGTKFMGVVTEDWRENWKVTMPKTNRIRLIPKSSVAMMELIPKAIAMEMMADSMPKNAKKGSEGSRVTS